MLMHVEGEPDLRTLYLIGVIRRNLICSCACGPTYVKEVKENIFVVIVRIVLNSVFFFGGVGGEGDVASCTCALFPP